MAIYAKVTRVMTTDFAEVSILDGIDGEPIDDTTYIAEFEGKKDNVRRDDIVEVVTAENRIMIESRIAYILPVVGAVLGFLFTVDELGHLEGKDLLCPVDLLILERGEPLHFLHGKEGEHPQALVDVCISHVSPVLIEFIGRCLVCIQPEGSLLGLAHLLSLRGGEK